MFCNLRSQECMHGNTGRLIGSNVCCCIFCVVDLLCNVQCSCCYALISNFEQNMMMMQSCIFFCCKLRQDFWFTTFLNSSLSFVRPSDVVVMSDVDLFLVGLNATNMNINLWYHKYNWSTHLPNSLNHLLNSPIHELTICCYYLRLRSQCWICWKHLQGCGWASKESHP